MTRLDCAWQVVLILFCVFQIQSIIIIGGFHICEFASSLKCICHPRINTCSAATVLGRHVQCWKIGVTWYTHSQGSTEEHSTCLFQLLYNKKCPFHRLSNASCFASLCFLVILSLFTMAVKCSAEVVSHVRSSIGSDVH